MKKVILCLAVVGALAVHANAESGYDSSVPNVLAVGLGAAIPLSANQFDQIAGQGAALSFEYFRRVAPKVDLGLGLAGFGFADKTLVTAPFSATAMTSASAFSVLTHFHPWEESRFSPYAAAGIGMSSYYEAVDTTPNPGFVWTDTRTRETRRTLEGRSNGFAMQIGLGIQANFSRHFIGAVETDWHYLTIDKNKFGANSIQVVQAGAKLGWRF